MCRRTVMIQFKPISGNIKGIYLFCKSICLNMKIIAQLEFELSYLKAPGQYVNHYAMQISIIRRLLESVRILCVKVQNELMSLSEKMCSLRIISYLNSTPMTTLKETFVYMRAIFFGLVPVYLKKLIVFKLRNKFLIGRTVSITFKYEGQLKGSETNQDTLKECDQMWLIFQYSPSCGPQTSSSSSSCIPLVENVINIRYDIII